MPTYNYTAADLQNNKTADVIDAKDPDDLLHLLRSKNLFLLKYREIEAKKMFYRLKANETAEFSRQLAGMLGSGITIVRAMEILKDRDFKPKVKAVYEKLFLDVQQGFTLSESMRLQEKSFPELLINMYASGEMSGQLEQVTQKMSVHYEKEHRLNGKVKSAMTYPTVLLSVTVVVVMLLFTVILPQFFELFKDFDLPGITRMILGLSLFLKKSWYLLIIGILICVALFQYCLRIPKFAIGFDKLKLNLPIIGKLLKIIYTARFSRTLSSLYTSGITMLNALEISGSIIANKYIESQFEEVITHVRNGELLSVSLGIVDGFDKKLTTTILIGEESGRLDSMLESTAESFDYEAEAATGRLVQLVEPVMIVIMAVVIGAVMLSVMLPLISLYENAGAGNM